MTLIKIALLFAGTAASLYLVLAVFYFTPVPAYKQSNKEGFLSSKDWQTLLSSVTTEPELIQDLNPTEQQSIALSRVNYYRSLANLNPVNLNKNLNRASQAHAEYNTMHKLSGHTEKRSMLGFSGVWPWDRMKYYNYDTFSYATEVCSTRWSSADYPLRIDPEWAVDSWMDTVYHRLAIINPNVYEAGFGADKTGNYIAYIMDFANPGFTPKKRIIYYPVNGQQNVPTEFTGDETPDPLPGKTYPVGYPITVTFNGYSNIKVEEVILTNDLDGVVDFYKLLPHSDNHIRETLAIIPEMPLRSGTIYRVNLLANADGKKINLNWAFRTR